MLDANAASHGDFEADEGARGAAWSPLLAEARTAAVAAPSSLEERFESEAIPHMRSLLATACRLTRNGADAEDLVQETYLRAFRAFEGYAPNTNIRGWLYTILYRTRTDQFRKAGRSPRVVMLVEDSFATAAPQDALAAGHEDVTRALGLLPEVYRTALVLRDVQDFSYDEMARILGIPIGTVMSRIHRGRAQMRRALSHRRPSCAA